MDMDSINDHSPWWARAFAIFLGIIVFLNVVNIFYLEVFGVSGINHYSFGNEPSDPGEYPENGTEEEQRKYNYSLSEWEDYQAYTEMMDDLEGSNVTEISQAFAILTVLVGIPTIAIFWTQNEKMLHFGIGFGILSIIGEVWKSYVSSSIVTEYMEKIPGGADFAWIPKVSILTSTTCGITYVALAIVMHNLYHSKNQLPESGFHLKVDTPTNQGVINGDNDLEY